MKFCPNCKKQVADDYRYCIVCGYDFQQDGAGIKVKKVNAKKVRKVKGGAPKLKKVKQVKAPLPPPTQPQPEIINYRAMAENAYGRGDYYGALDNYTLALMNDPGNFLLIMTKEKLLEMLNHKDEAVECLDEALRLQPENRELLTTKARLLTLLFHQTGEHHYKGESEETAARANDLRNKLISEGMCPSCNGVGTCTKCHATGNCHECGGTGVYKGAVKCPFCEGTGKCDRCKSSSNCPDCKGTGRLEMLECTACGSTGVCHKCHGKGKHLIGSCKDCHGTGYCSVCKGKGKIHNQPKEEKGEE